MAGITTALPTSFKQELLQGQHCFNGSATSTATLVTTSTLATALGTVANVANGCAVSGTGIPANTFVGNMASATSCYLTQLPTTAGSPTLTFTGHTFNLVLLIATVTGTYGATTTNYGSGTGTPTNANVGTDELATGSGYTQGGYAITPANNNTPTISSTTAYTTPNVNPSWTSATFSTSGCVMYNASNQTKAVYVGSFGGTQTVSAGTFTVLMPVNAVATALIRLA